MAEYLFWVSGALILYAYFAYPLLLALISLFRKLPIKKGDIKHSVSCIITAYNEEKRIHEKIVNTLRQDYPSDKLEIIVASDCSTDTTDEIVRSYRVNNVKLIRAAERKGKENAQKLAVESASGDVLVFSDVATMLQPDGISKIIANFSDPAVGCVSSVDRFIDQDGNISGEGAYVRYEMFIRKLETDINSLVGLSGSFFAARKEVCQDWASDLQSDFNTLLNSVKKGLRGISDPESIGYYRNIADEKKEFERKFRTVLRGMSVFMRNASLLNPVKYGIFAWQLFSHKLCRWLVPFALVAVFVSNIIIISFSSSGLFVFAMIFQAIFYILALLGMREKLAKSLKLPAFFVLTNLAILKAWYMYVKGERLLLWEPSKR